MQIALDSRAETFRATSLGNLEIGSVVSPFPASSSGMGILLQHLQPQHYSTRYILARDESGPYVANEHHADVFPCASAKDIRVVLSEILKGKLPGTPAEAIGLIGIDGVGAFAVVDARKNIGDMRAATICLREWSYQPGADRAYTARLFFSSWQIVVADQFGNRTVVL